jgi:multidrug efflux pump subunit AcrA (membrane-fusion protein)
VIKGKSKIASMQSALDVYITTSIAILEKSRAAIASFEAAHGHDLTPDKRELELKNPDVVSAELRRRLEARLAREEAERLRKEAEAARAEAEAIRRQSAEAEAARRQAASEQAAAEVAGQRAMADAGAAEIAPEVREIAMAATPPQQAPSNITPITDGEMTEGQGAAEWAAFRMAVVTSFGPLKVARGMLKHPTNVVRATEFATRVGEAWSSANQY